MKKALAAIAASALGLGTALIAGAAPAQAVTPKCTDATMHAVNPDVSPSDDWYMTCIPQYGMGKAEFTITTDASEPFPASYSLTDGHQSVTSSPTTAQVEAYFQPAWAEANPGTPGYIGAFVGLNQLDGDPTTQDYGTDPSFSSGTAPQAAAYPIASVGKATSGFPADCVPGSDPTATYQGEYVVTYGTTTTTFSQTINDVVHKVTVSFTPPPLYLGLNFTGSAGAMQVDIDAPICASSGPNTVFSPDQADDSADWIDAAIIATIFPPTLTTLDPATISFIGAPGPSAIATDFGSFASTSTPVLATTGVDPTPAIELGAGLLSAGAILGAIALILRRRRSRVPPPPQ